MTLVAVNGPQTAGNKTTVIIPTAANSAIFRKNIGMFESDGNSTTPLEP
jgi:hypothetical protein